MTSFQPATTPPPTRRTPAGVVVVIGAPGAGKSTFIESRWPWWQVLSSDRCRLMICDDEKDQSATPEAFDLLHALLRARCQRRKMTVIDATNVLRAHREQILEEARRCLLPAVAVLLHPSVETCISRVAQRVYQGGHHVDEDIIRKHHAAIAPGEVFDEFPAVRLINDTDNAVYGTVPAELQGAPWML